MRHCTARHDRLELHTPFRISRGVRTAADLVVVEIGEGELVGRGEGLPYARYDESVESVLGQIDEARAAVEAGASRDDLLRLLPAGAARNALDCALWDLEAKRAGRSVAQLIGSPEPGRIATALTVTIDTPEAMAASAATMADALLIKVKVDAEHCEARLRAVRAAAPYPKLIVDPNESWDRAILTELRGLLTELRVDLLEQPVPAGQDEWLEGFDVGVPVCADEAIHTAADLDTVARRYQAVNAKLDKSGGLTAALQLAWEARARGLTLMTGCMISSSLSIAPARHVAAISGFADLDGPLWLKDDRPGGVTADRGWLNPPAPGFWGDGR